MPYDIEASADNCYEGTTCLINKLDIRDEEELASVEAAPVSYTHLAEQSTPSTRCFPVMGQRMGQKQESTHP